ncbi:RNA polymerase sigma factor SigB [Brevibacillus laterosporus]|nr:RNA polymerase sigma factor SigB [Brevibacillus laterosporus]
MTESNRYVKEHRSDESLLLIQRFQEEQPTPELQQELVLHFRGLVESLVTKIHSGYELRDDLRQVGMIGLLAALSRYDPAYGGTFESFAIPTIIGEMKRFVRDKTWSIHVPRRFKEMSIRLQKAVDDLTLELHRSPQIEEIAIYIQASPEEVLEALEIGKNYRTISTDTQIEADQEGGTVTLLDLIGSLEDGYSQVEESMMLTKIYKVLTGREQEIITLTYFENLSQKEVGERLGISQMHVSRLQRRALQKLRESLRANLGELVNETLGGYHTK